MAVAFVIICVVCCFVVENVAHEEDLQRQLDLLKRVVDEKVTSLENENTELKQRLNEMENKIVQNSKMDVSVGFMAFLGADQLVVAGTNIRFSNVSLNLMNAYNLETGEYTCPVTGLYHFAFNAHGRADDNWTVQLRIARSDGSVEGLSSTCLIGAHTYTGGATSTVFCAQNERVSVVNAWPSDRTIWAKFDEDHQEGVFQSNFGGFMVNQEF